MAALARTLLSAALSMAALSALPPAHAQETKTMSTNQQELALAQHLIDLHFEIFNDRDPSHWQAKFPQAYTSDFLLADYNGLATGYAEVSSMIRKIQGDHTGFFFSPEPVAWNHGVGRVTWGYGPRDNPNLVRGEDIFTVRDGKLASARVFIDKK